MDIPKSHRWSCINFLGQEGHKDRNLINKYSTNNAVRRHLTPPAIILTASDDGLVNPVTNGLEYYKAMHDAGNECTLYSYPTGNHGWGFGPWFKYHDQMLNDLGNWLKNLQAPKPDAIRVACIGNSITDGHGIEMASQYGYPALLQKALGGDYWVKNFGVSGRTMLNKGDVPYMKEQAWRDAQAFNPDIVIIKLGTNDSKPQNWQYASEFKQDLQQMIKSLGKAKIFLCTPIPAFKSSWAINDSVIVNGVIPIQKEVARKNGLQLIDLHTLMANDEELVQPDGIHPNEKGVAKMAEIISEAIKKTK
jgi:lysophospholipase L1-like esterase